jgi:hypothetical protein
MKIHELTEQFSFLQRIKEWVLGPWLNTYGDEGKIFKQILLLETPLNESLMEFRGRDGRTSHVRFIYAAAEFAKWCKSIKNTKPLKCYTISKKGIKHPRDYYRNVKPNFIRSRSITEIGGAFFTSESVSNYFQLYRADNNEEIDTNACIVIGFGALQSGFDNVLNFILRLKKQQLRVIFHEYIHYMQWDRESDAFENNDRSIPWDRRPAEHEAEIGRWYFDVFEAAAKYKAGKISKLAMEGIARYYGFDSDFDTFFKRVKFNLANLRIDSASIKVQDDDEYTIATIRQMHSDIKKLLGWR